MSHTHKKDNFPNKLNFVQELMNESIYIDMNNQNKFYLYNLRK